MIRELDTAYIDDIDSIIARYREKATVPIPDDYEKRIKTNLSKGQDRIIGAYSPKGDLEGIAVFSKGFYFITLLFADDTPDIEKRLIQGLLDILGPEYSHLISIGSWITPQLAKCLTDTGFVEHPRTFMVLEKPAIEALQELVLPPTMRFVPYSPAEYDVLIDLAFRCFANQKDIPRDPNNLDQGWEMIKGGQFGEFKPELSKLLKTDDLTIGFCILLVRGSDTGYIPIIGVAPEHRGKGLGRRLLVHSIKHLVATEPAIIKIALDVTLSNPAINLYDSLGFTRVADYSVYTWIR